MLTSNVASAKHRNFSICSPRSGDKGVPVSFVLSISVLSMEFFVYQIAKMNVPFGSLLRGSCKSHLFKFIVKVFIAVLRISEQPFKV